MAACIIGVYHLAVSLTHFVFSNWFDVFDSQIQVLFNVRPFFYPENVQRNALYLVMILLLFLYAIFVLLIFNNTKWRNIQPIWILSTKYTIIWVIFAGLMTLMSIFFKSSIIWLIILTAPWMIPQVSKINNIFQRYRTIIYVVLLIISLSLFFNILRPLLFDELKIKNEYLDIPEYTILKEKVVDNTEFISNHNIFGNHPLYDIHNYQFSVNDDKGQCELFGGSYGMSYNDEANINDKRCIFKKVATGSFIQTSVIGFQEELKKYTQEEKDFIVKNHLELREIIYDGSLIIHHFNHIVEPINELNLGKNIKDINVQYGLFNLFGIREIARITTGYSYQGILKILFVSSFVYYCLFILLAYIFFRRIEYVIILILGITYGFYKFGYLPMLVGVGFWPTRHIFDLGIIIFWFFFIQRSNILFLLGALFFSILGVVNEPFYGLIGMMTLGSSFIIRFFMEDYKNKILSIIFMILTLLTGFYIFQYIKFGRNAISNNLFLGLLNLPLPFSVIYMFAVFVVFYIILFILHKGTGYMQYISWFFFFYVQFLLFHFMLITGPNNFWSIFPFISFFCTSLIYLFFEKAQRKTIIAYLQLPLFYIICATFIIIIFSTIKYFGSMGKSELLSGKHSNLIEQKGEYDNIFKTHVVFRWQFPTASFITTMDPSPFIESVNTIQKYCFENQIYLLSKYDNILPFLAGKYNGLPFIETLSYLIVYEDIQNVIDTIQRNKPIYLFVDTDILRDKSFDSVDAGVKYLGYLSGRSFLRANKLNLLKQIFLAVEKEYIPVTRGSLITVYQRL